MRSLRPSATLIVVLMPLLASAARGGVIFSDDFETYSTGNLKGRGGWATNTSPSHVQIATGTYLHTNVIDGQAPTGVGMSWLGHALPSFDPGLDVVSSLSFRAYAKGNIPHPVVNNGLGFTNDVLGTVPNLASWVTGGQVGGWFFYPAGFISDDDDRYFIPDSYDRVVDLSIVIDASNLEVYGIYRDSTRVVETNHWPVTPAAVASIRGIKMHINSATGGRSGPEIDNIVVTQASSVPEPASIVSLSIGAVLGLAGCRARRITTSPPPLA